MNVHACYLFCDIDKMCGYVLCNAYRAREWAFYGFLARTYPKFTTQMMLGIAWYYFPRMQIKTGRIDPDAK